MARAIPYKSAIKWLALNDDCQWCINGEESMSVSAALVADIYKIDDSQVRTDLEIMLREMDNPK